MHTRRERGFTLTEVLVATAIFTIIMLAALLMYDRNNRVFTQGVQASEVQQNTRIGFDKLVSEIRVEGFDYNRNGSPSGSDLATGVNYQRQPDEQIEYMGESAITFRANLNYNSNPDNGRETAGRAGGGTYESAAFPLVTTSNKEIITYALKSEDDSRNTSTIDFYADVSKPRKTYVGAGGENREHHVLITGYDTTNANPPYTLYRITLKDAQINDNDPDPVGEAVPIATKIRSLRFIYYADQGGNTVLAPAGGAGQYDASTPGNLIPERDTRRQIQAIRVELVGMNEAPDAQYSNGLEPAGSALSHFREYSLSSLVVPRNVGKRAVREENLKGPNAPILKSICYGACGVPYLTWQAPVNSSDYGAVEFYSIIYDTSPNGTFSSGYPVGNVTAAYFPRPLNPGTTYYFKIEASNGYGDAISGDVASVRAVATTTPEAPTNLTATGGTNKITIQFKEPTKYTAGSPDLTCLTPAGTGAGTDPISANGIAPPEAIAYRVYRYQEKSGGANASFNPATEGELIASESNGVQPYIDANGLATLDDYVPACIRFYYRVQAVASGCIGAAANNSPAQTSVSGSAFTPAAASNALDATATVSSAPAAPQNFTLARSAGCPAANTTIGPNIKCSLTLGWDKVTQDTGTPSQPIKVDNYVLTRTLLQPSTNPNAGRAATIPVPSGLWDELQSSGNRVTVVDDFSTPLPDGSVAYFPTDGSGVSYQYRYTLSAKTCSSSSSTQTLTEPSCYLAPSSAVVTSSALAGSGSYANPFQVSGFDTISFNVNGMAASTIQVSMGGAPIEPARNYSAAPATYQWPTGLSTGAVYQMDFVAKDSSGCSYTVTAWVVDQGGVCPYNSPPSPNVTPTQNTTGLTSATAWQLRPGDTIKFNQSDLASLRADITDTSTNVIVSTINLTGSSETLTWPTKTYGTTYRVDITLTSTASCQRQVTYFVTQICNGYSGGAPTITSSDTVRTGTAVALAWQLSTSNSITVSESRLANLKVTVTDLTASRIYASTTTTASSGVATVTWPPKGVTNVPNDVYQVDMVLIDSSGCSSTTYTRYVSSTCTFNNGAAYVATTAAVSTTIRKTGDPAGTGASSLSAAQMVPNVDQVSITVTGATLAKAYITYVDPTTKNALAGVSTITATGASPLKFTNPYISGRNGQTVALSVILEDGNGCRTSSPTYFYIVQVPCVLKPRQSATDNTVLGVPVYSNSSKTSTQTITVTNLKTTALTVNSVSFTLPSLGSSTHGNTTAPNAIQTVTFPKSTTTITTNTNGGATYTITPSVAETIPASGTWSFTITYDYNATSANPLNTQPFCVTYTTTTTTPAAATQSCNLQYNSSGFNSSASNPGGCD